MNISDQQIPELHELPPHIQDIALDYYRQGQDDARDQAWREGYRAAEADMAALQRQAVQQARTAAEAPFFDELLELRGQTEDAVHYRDFLADRGIIMAPSTRTATPQPPSETSISNAGNASTAGTAATDANAGNAGNAGVPDAGSPDSARTSASRSRSRRTVRTTAPASRRSDELEALHATIVGQIETLKDSEAWKAWLTYAASFRSYSVRNILLIHAQRPMATQVAGYKSWQERGRQVRKGERGIRILGGKTVVRTETNPDSGEEEEKRRVQFFPCSVFDVEQTDLVDPSKEPEPIARRLDGSDELGIYGAAFDYLTGLGWQVRRELIPGETNGYTQHEGKTIVVDEGLSPAMSAKTLLHESAHALMHAPDIDGDRYVEHRGEKEVEAESVAYLVAHACGLDTSEYSVGYIAGWAGGREHTLIEQTATRVLETSRTLLDAISSPTRDEPATATRTRAAVHTEQTQADTEAELIDRIHGLPGITTPPAIASTAANRVDHGSVHRPASASHARTVMA